MMPDRLSDAEPDEILFREQFGSSLGTLRTTGCPDPRMLPALEQGALPEELAATVKQHLKRCPLCLHLASQMAALPAAEATPEVSERILARIRQAAAPAALKERPSGGRSMRNPWWWMLAPAAAALLVFAIMTRQGEVDPASSPVSTKPASERPPAFAIATLIPLEQAPIDLPVEAVLTWRSEPDTYYGALVAALVPYKEGLYEEAARRLEEVVKLHPARTEAKFYLGVCELMRGAAREAVLHLKPVGETPAEKWNRMAKWYLAQALLRAEDPEGARGVLRVLCGSAGQYQQQACGAVEKLDRAKGD